jgi:hypothetical protein
MTYRVSASSPTGTVTSEQDTAHAAIVQAPEFLAAGMTDVVILDPLGESYRPKILTEVIRKHTVQAGRAMRLRKGRTPGR